MNLAFLRLIASASMLCSFLALSAIPGRAQQMTPAAAARFLEQASWGPTISTVTDLQASGITKYVNAQFKVAGSPINDIDPLLEDGGNGFISNQVYQNAAIGSDQMRQRVAFALSQIWVVSSNKIQNEQGMTTYYRTLSNDAFGNYLTIMKDMTLNPAMGHYLDMVNNDKANPVKGTEPNENYAREILQLFTVGLSKLNRDGTLQLSGGNPIDSYSQDNVSQLARVMTGWTYAPAPGGTTRGHNNTRYTDPMVAYAPNHDIGAKTLLDGGFIGPGGTAEQDLDAALGLIFNNPNLPPFVCKQMIQHLTTSNPSTGYVLRVVSVFEANAAGVRGDMKSVVKAILLDPEARAADTSAPAKDFGHLKEPTLFISGLLRALNATVPAVNNLRGFGSSIGQDVLNAPSVFNYYSPDYHVSDTLLGPEFQLHSGTTAIGRTSIVNTAIYGNLGNGVTIDLSPWSALAANANNLVDAVNSTFLHGAMSATMRSNILTAIAAKTTALDKAKAALYIAASSEEYSVSN